jgi:hypothetical protein
MSLLFLDSVDHDAAEARWTQIWSADPNVDSGVSAVAPRTGAQCIVLNGNGRGGPRVDFSANATWFVGFGFKSNSLLAELSCQFQTMDGTATVQGRHVVNATTGTVSVQRGTTTVATSTDVIVADTYAYHEFKHIVDNTTGVLEARMNGVVIATFTGDTQDTGNATASSIRCNPITGSYTGQTQKYDDIYICNGDGTVNNDYLAGTTSPYFTVDYLMPNGAGTTTEWTPNENTNWQNVDGITSMIDGTSYNSTAIQDEIDTYALSGMSAAVGTIAGIRWISATKDEAVGNTALKRVIRISGANYFGSAFDPTTSYAFTTEIIESSPATSVAFTEGEVDGAEAGIQLTAVGGLLTARINHAGIEVGYNSEPAAGGGALFVLPGLGGFSSLSEN